MATQRFLTFVFPLMLYAFTWMIFATLMAASARHLLETPLPKKPEELPKPEIPTLPKPELPPLPKVESPPLPHLPPLEKPELPELPKPELPKLPELPTSLPKPVLPTLPKDVPLPSFNPPQLTNTNP